MGFYSATTINASALAATIGNCLFYAWNPSSDIPVRLIEMGFTKPGVVSANRWELMKISTRGSPASTVTPGADNDWNAQQAPRSGLLLDVGPFTAGQPTNVRSIQAAAISGASAAGAGLFFYFDDWETAYVIEPGTGVAIIQGNATATEAGHLLNLVWDEER